MSDRRLVAAMGKMGADNEHERLIGLKAATAILDDRGMTWANVAEMITGRTLADMTAPEGSRRRDPVRDEAPVRERPPGRVSGADIPSRVTGKVRILEEDAEGVVIEMMGGAGWWGPMRVAQERQIADVRIAANRSNPRDATVITAHRGGDAVTDVIDVRVRFAGAWND